MRIQSLDLARGFTVLFIPAIHTVMLYSKTEVYTTWLGYPLQFIAEGPGGQLLMVLMGIVFAFQAEHYFSDVLKRAGLLLAAGYALNVLKFVLPYSIGVLPEGVERDLELDAGLSAYWQLFSLGDILHFAALALPSLFMVHVQWRPYRIALLFIPLFLFGAPYLWDLSANNLVASYLFGLHGGHPPQVFFPFVSWIIYPLVGLLIGYGWKANPLKTIPMLLIAGIYCLAAGWAWNECIPRTNPYGFYRTWPAATILHIGIVLVWLYLWHWLAKLLRSCNGLVLLLEYSSRHITQIYLIQWVLICWLLPLIGYQQLGVWASFSMACLITLVTYALSMSYDLLQEYRKRR